MNAYQNEQQDALSKATDYLKRLSRTDKKNLKDKIRPYILFRKQVDNFLTIHCSDYCTRNCYTSKSSACCSKDGIITFWADVLINACCSNQDHMFSLMASIQNPMNNHKCIYLTKDGCCWQVRPLVCAMFLCEPVQQDLCKKDGQAFTEWKMLSTQAKSFRWPDRPVLFDQLEQCCMEAGIKSPLMYLNHSPGLLKVKQTASLIP